MVHLSLSALQVAAVLHACAKAIETLNRDALEDPVIYSGDCLAILNSANVTASDSAVYSWLLACSSS